MILLGILSFIVGIYLLIELYNIQINGWPTKDDDLLEMINAFSDEYTKLDTNYSSETYIEGRNWKTPRIIRSKFSLLFPYYIPSVGVIPDWYKSKKEIDVIFKHLEIKHKVHKKESKRSKLGLDD